MNQIYGLGKVIKDEKSGKVKLTLNNPQIFGEELRGLSGDVVVTVKEGRPTRSNAQNRYLWGVVYKTIAIHLSDLTGEVYEDWHIHEYYKDKFLSKKKHFIIGDEESEIEIGSTRRLNTKEFEEFTENIRRHAAEFLELSIAEPNE